MAYLALIPCNMAWNRARVAMTTSPSVTTAASFTESIVGRVTVKSISIVMPRRKSSRLSTYLSR